MLKGGSLRPSGAQRQASPSEHAQATLPRLRGLRPRKVAPKALGVSRGGALRQRSPGRASGSGGPAARKRGGIQGAECPLSDKTAEPFIKIRSAPQGALAKPRRGEALRPAARRLAVLRPEPKCLHLGVGRSCCPPRSGRQLSGA